MDEKQMKTEPICSVCMFAECEHDDAYLVKPEEEELGVWLWRHQDHLIDMLKKLPDLIRFNPHFAASFVCGVSPGS